MIKYIIHIILFFFFTSVSALETVWSQGEESQVRIISPLSNIGEDKEIFLGIQYKLKDGWKTYWKSPGEGGFSQEIKWNKSHNVENVEVLWPTPEEFNILGIRSIGYTNDVIFPLKLNIINIAEEVSLVLDINYLICEAICIPGTAFLELILPPGKAEITKHFFSIEKSISSLPIQNLEVSGLKSTAIKSFNKNKENISIVIDVISEDIFKDPKIYLHSEFGLPVVQPAINYYDGNKKLVANFDFDKKLFSKKKFPISVLIDDKNIQPYEFIETISLEENENNFNINESIIFFLIISLLGGLILNLMPCVLPVLSIKILSFLRKSNDKTSIRKSFFITSLGIISSFTFLAFILLILRFLGFSIGWGIQFQQPLFLIIMAVIILLFSLNLFGFYEFRTPSFVNIGFIQKLNSNKYTKDFFNGFFATVLATPCSAPFVGTAITAAFTQTSFVMILIFVFMGIGMSLPYFFISLFPGSAKIFPKPGKWMNYFRYFLGMLLFGTFIWISSILLNHSTYFSDITAKVDESNWKDIKQAKIDELINDNNIVFVDITADWCATCKYNKIKVINSKKIKNLFKKYNIVQLRGDWTKQDKIIEKYLRKHNRFGIPLNVVYSKLYPDGIILSELLTKKEIINTIKKAEIK